MDARDAVRKRRKKAAIRFLKRGGGAAAVIALVAFVVDARRGTADAGEVVVPKAAAATKPAPGYPVKQTGVPAAARKTSATPADTPAVPQGRTSLANGLVAERTGNAVVVHFDTPETRTRRRDKLERVVRETLPTVLGDAGAAALSQVEPGALVRGDLLDAVRHGPLRLPIGDGRIVTLTLGARPGTDGPLVVTYEARVQPASHPPAS